MHLEDILPEREQLDEVPASGISQAAKKSGSRLLNVLPSGTAKSKAANLAGKADLGDTANRLHKELNNFLGRRNKSMKDVSGDDVVDFLKMKKHTTSVFIPSGNLSKQQISKILKEVASEAMERQASTPATGTGSGNRNNSGQNSGNSSSNNSDKPQLPKEIKSAIDQLSQKEKDKLMELL